MKLALCGNPNVGKTTLFNRLTRSSAPVGNWHGVTVDAKSKHVTGKRDILLCDLPGAYSLTARSAEECITRDGILFGDYDAIVFVAEANNLRRNLYLLTQVAEAGKKVVLVVNMMDEARKPVNLEMLSQRLGVPVVGASEKRENPRAAILDAVCRATPPKLEYLRRADVVALAARVNDKAVSAGLTPSFVALKTLERDEFVSEKTGIPKRACTAACGGCEVDLPARLRYAYIDGVLSGVFGKPTQKSEKRKRLGEKIDRVVLGKAALPIFLAVMACVFVITFEAGKPLSDLMASLPSLAVGKLGAAIRTDWVRSLVCDGIISGVGAVLAFLPQTVLLFLLTALLQDSGYMSRVAFVTDDFFKKFGLGGRAAFSVILGLGCSATAVMSTRGIAEKSVRLRTAFVAPYVPCSARLAVFTAISAYFGLSGAVVAALYVLGFAVALAVLKITGLFENQTRTEELLMEIPPYRVPSPLRVIKSVGRDICAFLGRVGSVVLCVNLIIWALSSFSVEYGFSGGTEAGLMRTFSELIAPIFSPLGFGNWRAVTALISGIAAKETVVSTIASLGGADAVFGSTAAAVSFLIFTCLYIPCVATLAAVGKECGVKIAVLSAVTHFVVAYVASLMFFSAATVKTDFRLFATVWSCVCVAIGGIAVFARVKKAKKIKHSVGEKRGT